MNFLLDTHVVLWSIYEPDRIPSSLQTALLQADNRLYLSEASLWEPLDKAAKRRLPLAGGSPEQVLDRIHAFGALPITITENDILASVSLPPHHGDPFDRMLVAQAQIRGLTLVTCDKTLSLYAVPIVWT